MDVGILVVLVFGVLAALALGWWLGGRSTEALRAELVLTRAEREQFREEASHWKGEFGKIGVNLAAEAEKVTRIPELQAQLVTERQATSLARSEADSLRPVAERVAHQDREVATLRAEKERLAAEKAAFERGEAERQQAHEKQLAQLDARFSELAAKAVDGAHERFLTQAENRFDHAGKQNEEKLTSLLQPVRDTLARYEAGLKEIEIARTGAYEGLRQQITLMREGQDRVASEASRLRTTLRSSTGSVGRWGEDQCENVLERAGLQEGIDFEKQVTSETVGDRARPDFIVHLPGNRRLIIDVKCSLDAYVGATETEDESLRDQFLIDHAKAIKSHAQGLLRKEYQSRFKNSADFVVMFVPGENFLHAAIQRDRHLLSWSYENNIIIVGPTNFVSLALNISSIRGQEKMNERAEEVAKLGRQLYTNLNTLGKKSHAMRKSIETTVASWNDLVKTLDGNLLNSARKFDELGVGKNSENVRELTGVDNSPIEPLKLISTYDDSEFGTSPAASSGIAQ